jgi:HK97 family phage portal protein
MKSLREIFQRNSNNSEKKELNYVSPFSDALNFGQYIANATSMSVSAVSRAVNIISDSIAMLPIQVVNFNEDHIQVDPNHPLNTIFNSAHINSYNLKACLIRDVLLYGNGYAYIFRDGISGMPESLLYLPATTVTCDYNEVAGTVTYSCTKLKNLKKLLPQNIIHLKKYTTDGVNGISVLKYASRSIGIANATEDQCKDFFESGCNLSGVLTVEGQLSDRQKNDIRTSWQ